MEYGSGSNLPHMDYGSGSSSNPPPNVTIPTLQRLDVEHFQALPEWKAGIVRIISRSIRANDKGQFLDEDGEILPLGGLPVLSHSVCTGFIVNEGYIVTAAHGVCDWYFHNTNALMSGFRLRSLEITGIAGVELEEGIITRAVAVDTGADLALLPLPHLFRPSFSFKLAAEGNVAVGQSVCTFGHPADYPWDFKSGKVAHLRRPGNDSIPHYLRSPAGFFMIEVDYVAPPGFSGGPQITSAGEVVGVNQSNTRIDNEVLLRRNNFISFVVPVNFLHDLMLWHMLEVKEGDPVFLRNDGKGQFHINLVEFAERNFDPQLVHVLVANFERVGKGLPE